MGMNVYDVINSRIMELLEQGTVPWRKTWNAQSNYPKNLVSKKNYQGVNVWLLACQEFSSPWHLTFKQAQDMGGHVIKGSKSTPVIFWKWLDRKDANSIEGESGNNGKIPLLRYYSVFNLCQTEGIEAPSTTEVINTFTPIERADHVIAGMPYKPEIRHGGNKASYSPMLDFVRLPEPISFELPEEYYSTAFHELTHATGHASRVGRKGITARENMQHAGDMRLNKTFKTSYEDKILICQIFDTFGITKTRLARIFGVSAPAISYIITHYSPLMNSL